MVASLSTFQPMWISKHEYDQSGPSIVGIRAKQDKEKSRKYARFRSLTILRSKKICY